MGNPTKILAPRENGSHQNSDALDSVLDRNRATQTRGEIGITIRDIRSIAYRSFREGVISDQAYEEYRQLTDSGGAYDMTAEMLESTRKFALEHETRAIRVSRKIQAAMQAGIASEVDEEFLMEKLVVDNIQFLSQADQIEQLIDKKIEHMKADRKAYDGFANHPLVKNVGYLKTGPTTKVEVPDAKAFLALTVPERRELLEKLEKVLPEAEEYAKETANFEEGELSLAYKAKLDAAFEAKIIGQHTYENFLDGFQKIDRDEKIEWISGFGAQMERYETLWGQIRNTLQGDALDYIEAKRDEPEVGYTKLLTEFGKLKQAESSRLNASYKKALEGYLRTPENPDGVIGKHTLAEFSLWMFSQDLSTKYEAIKEETLSKQMVRYQKLWSDADTITGKERAFLSSKMNVWGYTELSQQLEAFKRGEGLPVAGSSKNKEDPLSQVRSKAARDAIVEIDDSLTEAGSTRKSAFIRILDRAFMGVRRDDFDSHSFQGGLDIRRKLAMQEVANDNAAGQQQAANDNAIAAQQAAKDDADLSHAGLANRRIIHSQPANDSNNDADLSRAADDAVDESEIDERLDSLDQIRGVEVRKGDGFAVVEGVMDFKAEESRGRDLQVVANREEGVKRFIAEDGKNAVLSEAGGGEDEVSVAYDVDGETRELEYMEIMALRDHLKMTSVQSAAANDNAGVMEEAA